MYWRKHGHELDCEVPPRNKLWELILRSHENGARLAVVRDDTKHKNPDHKKYRDDANIDSWKGHRGITPKKIVGAHPLQTRTLPGPASANFFVPHARTTRAVCCQTRQAY